jgi:diaminopimelate decarboxylase
MDGNTPLLIFNKSKFLKIYAQYSQIGQIFYPIKSNDSLEVIKTVKELKGNFETDGINHIKYLIQKENVEPNRILYSIPIRKTKDIKEAVQLGVSLFAIDSFTEYEKIRQIKQKLNYIVRIDVSEFVKAKQLKDNKWGIEIKDALELFKQINSYNDTTLGISFYLPEGTFSFYNFKNVLDKICLFFSNQSIKYINIGGGLDDLLNNGGYVQELEKVKKQFNCSFIVEPGRNLLNPCFKLLTSVIGVKKTKRHNWIFIDCGIYSGLLDVKLTGKNLKISQLRNDQSKMNKFHISGPTSDLLDYIGEYEFTDDIHEGDNLLIDDCGAYTYVFQTHFSGFNTLKIEVEKQ